jgi:hypothetical protein
VSLSCLRRARARSRFSLLSLAYYITDELADCSRWLSD